MAIFRKRIKDPISGTAQVVSATGIGDGNSVYANCHMTLVVPAEGIPAYDVTHKQICPTAKWPFPGSVVPVTVSRTNPERLRIEFDDMLSTEDRAAAQAEQQAASLRGDHDASSAVPVQWTVGGPDDLTDQQKALIENVLGMDLDGDGVTGSQDDRIAKIERLAALRDSGALTEDEFAAEKRRILGD